MSHVSTYNAVKINNSPNGKKALVAVKGVLTVLSYCGNFMNLRFQLQLQRTCVRLVVAT